MPVGLPSTLRLVEELPDGSIVDEINIHGPQGFTTGIYCTAFDLGFPDPRELVQPRPGVSGTLDDTYLYGARTFTCSLKVINTDNATRHQTLQRIRRMFAAHKRPILYVRSDGWEGERRMILRGNPISTAVNRASHVRLEVSLSANCPEGVLESGNSSYYPVYPGGTNEGRTYGKTYGWEYDAGFASQVAYILNNGDLKTPPILRIYGPATNPSIRNTATVNGKVVTKELYFPGMQVSDSDFVVIDVTNRTVQASGGDSMYKYLDPDISSWWEIETGENIVNFNAEDTTTGTRLEVFFRERYI